MLGKPEKRQYIVLFHFFFFPLHEDRGLRILGKCERTSKASYIKRVKEDGAEKSRVWVFFSELRAWKSGMRGWKPRQKGLNAGKFLTKGVLKVYPVHWDSGEGPLRPEEMADGSIQPKVDVEIAFNGVVFINQMQTDWRKFSRDFCKLFKFTAAHAIGRFFSRIHSR